MVYESGRGEWCKSGNLTNNELDVLPTAREGLSRCIHLPARSDHGFADALRSSEWGCVGVGDADSVCVMGR